jgi:hypothetical protein
MYDKFHKILRIETTTNRISDFKHYNRETGRKKLMKISSSLTDNNRHCRGFNFFDEKDLHVLRSILRGEFNMGGFRNKDLRKFLKLTASQIGRPVKRLRLHGLIKKAGKSYKYYLTSPGKESIIMAQKVKETVPVPAFC